MRCIVCGNEQFRLIHHGTRDRADIDVLECEICGGAQLSDFSQIADGFYENSGMHQSADIRVLSDATAMTDDIRRAQFFSEDYREKNLLDFGCGWGGFLRLAKNYAKSVSGVELEAAARKFLEKESICMKAHIEEQEGPFDMITMFHVIEHLTEPLEILEKIREKLVLGGKLIIETPNAADILLKKYGCRAFADFTYWSCHVFLYTSRSLELLMKEAGFQIVWNRQIQRYPLSNHLYWLTEGKPGGHREWEELNSGTMREEYQRLLEAAGMCDTLLMCAVKN